MCAAPSSFLRDRRGLAALEFALIASLMLIPLIIGLTEILTLFRADTKLASLAFDTAQMVALESQSVTNGISTIPVSSATAPSLQDICQGAVLGMAPLPTAGLTIAIAGVTLESAPSGTAGTPVNSSARTYDVWEQDFTVSGNSCAAAATSAIGAAEAEAYGSSSPPSVTGTVSAAGLLQTPCDNVLLVQASMAYPGMIGVVLSTRPTITQLASTRWRTASEVSELECSGCSVSQIQSPQLCNSSNTGN